MNVLLTLNSDFVNYAVVMLTSLFENNKVDICIYILHSNLNDNDKTCINQIVNYYGGTVTYLDVDNIRFQDFPTTSALPVECYYICCAHELLPPTMERVLYLDADVIVDGDISELYNMDFEGNYLIACGQTFEKEEGNYYGIGARPEYGEQFNSGVMLFNLGLMRSLPSDCYTKTAFHNSYNWALADQGLFNLVFENKAKIISSYLYNFRIGILEKHIKNGNCSLFEDAPRIIHFVMRDYYRIGVPSKPWFLTLSREEELRLYENGFQRRPYQYRQVDDKKREIHSLWWKYAKQTNVWHILDENLRRKKAEILSSVIGDDMLREQDRVKSRKTIREELDKIKNGQFSNDYYKISYGELEDYIDELDADTAIQTMRDLFAYNCENIRKKNRIRTAFLVYSSSEWQCDEIYKLMNNDYLFEPVVVVCAYAHGTNESIRENYIKTCEFFRKKKNYKVEYLGYCNRWVKNSTLDRFDLIIYISPYTALMPYGIGLRERSIRQLAIQVPYSYYLANRKDVYYSFDIYNDTMIKMSWINCCQEAIEMDIARKAERLKGYNSVLSGFPKMDEYFENKDKAIEENDYWKVTSQTKYKVIWAPHFNLRKGMNGTFADNYRWFLEYAKEHKEISWVLKPHPRMEWGVLEYGVFKNREEYKAYIREWNELENATVVEYGDYFNLFKTSDAMILDSISFLVEYQFTEKPMLFLLPDNPRSLNEFGERILEVIYQSNGKDFKRIETFLESCIKEDRLKSKRVSFKENVLDCMNTTGMMASEYIYKVVKERLV